MDGLKHLHKKDISSIHKLISSNTTEQNDFADQRIKRLPKNQPAESQPESLDWSHVKPVGYVKSVFKTKNGTPRQSGVVPSARASLTLLPDLFTNPGHSLDGLHQFSHVWIIFVFHQNKNNYTKAKVQPPRLNGAKAGLFSTRCPYRPNPLGLSLVKLDAVDGSTLHLSGVDLVDGTPVLDIKPYIPQYDQPLNAKRTEESPTTESQNSNHVNQMRAVENTISESCYEDTAQESRCESELERGMFEQERPFVNEIKDATIGVSENANVSACLLKSDKPDPIVTSERVDFNNKSKRSYNDSIAVINSDKHVGLEQETRLRKDDITQQQMDSGRCFAEEIPCKTTPLKLKEISLDQPIIPRSSSEFEVGRDTETTSDTSINESNNSDSQSQINIANWISVPPVNKLTVCFSNRVEKQLIQLKELCDNGSIKLEYLRSCQDAREAITNILSNDPRSTYRRNKCTDKLYYFNVDILHVTCWFDDELNMAEVLKVKW